MKKSVILMICVVYIFAIVIVGFLGLAMKVYDENKYVKEIQCINKEYKPNPNKKENDGAEDGFINISYEKGLVFNLNCIVKPDDATQKKLEYIGEDDSTIYSIEVQSDGTANIVFKTDGVAIIIVKATDTEGKKIKIKITAFDIGGII